MTKRILAMVLVFAMVVSLGTVMSSAASAGGGGGGTAISDPTTVKEAVEAYGDRVGNDLSDVTRTLAVPTDIQVKATEDEDIEENWKESITITERSAGDIPTFDFKATVDVAAVNAEMKEYRDTVLAMIGIVGGENAASLAEDLGGINVTGELVIEVTLPESLTINPANITVSLSDVFGTVGDPVIEENSASVTVTVSDTVNGLIAKTEGDAVLEIKCTGTQPTALKTTYVVNGEITGSVEIGDIGTMICSVEPKEGDAKVEATVVVNKSGGNGGGSSSKEEATQNPDGSTTVTETNKTTGTTTETTTWPDGSKEVVETEKDGTTTTTTTDKEGNENKVVEGADGTVTTTTKDTEGTVSTTVENPDGSSESVTDKADGTKVTSNTSAAGSTIATVIIPETVEEAEVVIPVKDATEGTVAVIVNPDGTEQVIKNTVAVENGVSVVMTEGAILKVVDNSKGFVDMENHWAEDYVDFVSARSIMNGTSDTHFSPYMDTTRAMMAVILHNYEENPDHIYEGVYADVHNEHWHAEAIGWLTTHGFATGYPGGNYGPDDLVTREQLAVFLHRYAGLPVSDTEVTFADKDQIGGYAVDAIAWAVENGILEGRGNNVLDPKARATRAEVAAMFTRFVKNVMR